MEKNVIHINEEQLKVIISESVKNILMEEFCDNSGELDESLFGNHGWFNRMNNARKNIGDNAANSMFGLDGRTNVGQNWKMEKALELYGQYRDLLLKQNQLFAQVSKKSQKAFGTNYKGAYGAAKNYAAGGYGKPSQEPVNETVGRGLQSMWNNTKNNFKTKPIGQLFNGYRDAFAMGDAAGDTEGYQKVVAQANQAKAAFLGYCQKNGLNPQEVVKMFDNENRLNLQKAGINGPLSAEKEKWGKKDSVWNGKTSGAGNATARNLGTGAGAASAAQSRIRTSRAAQGANRDFQNNGGGMLEEKDELDVAINESIKKVLGL